MKRGWATLHRLHRDVKVGDIVRGQRRRCCQNSLRWRYGRVVEQILQ